MECTSVLSLESAVGDNRDSVVTGEICSLLREFVSPGFPASDNKEDEPAADRRPAAPRVGAIPA
jgi:hypothetical protein